MVSESSSQQHSRNEVCNVSRNISFLLISLVNHEIFKVIQKTICNSVLHIRTMQEEGLEVIWQLGDAQLVFRRKQTQRLWEHNPHHRRDKTSTRKSELIVAMFSSILSLSGHFNTCEERRNRWCSERGLRWGTFHKVQREVGMVSRDNDSDWAVGHRRRAIPEDSDQKAT